MSIVSAALTAFVVAMYASQPSPFMLGCAIFCALATLFTFVNEVDL